MTNDGWTNLLLAILPDVQQGGALWSTDPFVAIPCIVGSAELMQLQRQHSRCVRAIHQGGNAAVFQFAYDAFQRENQARLARDMIDQGDPRPAVYPPDDRLDNLIF